MPGLLGDVIELDVGGVDPGTVVVVVGGGSDSLCDLVELNHGGVDPGHIIMYILYVSLELAINLR